MSYRTRRGRAEHVDRYPLSLDVAGLRVLVVGGGPVAARRAHGLVEAGALVDVVTPWACEQMWELADTGHVSITLREYQSADVDGKWLVHAATGDRAVDDTVAQDCRAQRLWCVRADDAAASPAWTPAVARVDDVTVAVTGGGDPGRSRAVRDAIAALLADGSLPVRRTRPPAEGSGWVALVGGGPGDPGLITTRGRHLLAAADVVVVDRLAPRALLDHLDPDVQIVEAGKGPDAHTMTQQEINTTLVEHARAGRRVVRLKGGDPFVLGRGGEEVLACADAGIPVEVVPGVTSAIAGAAVGGVPVTHRGTASSFRVVSAHDHVEDAFCDAVPGTTLVVLMGAARIDTIVEALLARGFPATTPVAVVERATLPDQRVTTGCLSTIAAQSAAIGICSPAVIVVGEVAALSVALSPALTRVSV